jgi:nucleoside-diphosphate-sugar epimerase
MADRPRIVITGASGFLGRRLVRRLRADHDVVALDRRPQAESGVDEHPNVRWIQLDLADAEAVDEAFGEVRAAGGARAVVHLAAYYDFTGEEHPEYQRTNVDALRLVLEASRGLGLARFVFASSVAAHRVTRAGVPVTEDSPPDGEHVYARTKAAGEAMVRSYAPHFPSVIVRFGALFSDWCEYPPLYVFIDTWLSERWNARVLGGRGESAIPFLHVRDAADLVARALERADTLDPGEVLIASTDGTTSHHQLFEAATAYHFGVPRRPLRLPRPFAWAGLHARDAVKRVMGERPFERPWMADFIDTRLVVDARRTRARLDWAPHPRLAILHRLPFMIENRKTDPLQWLRVNREALEHLTPRPGFAVYRLLKRHEPAIGAAFDSLFDRADGPPELARYRALSEDERHWHRQLLLGSLLNAVRTGEKVPFMTRCRELATRRQQQGFPLVEVIAALQALERIALATLAPEADAAGLGQALHDHLGMTIEFGIDQVLEVYEDAEPAR